MYKKQNSESKKPLKHGKTVMIRAYSNLCDESARDDADETIRI